jgi:HK97 family phage major capsid protein
MTFHDKDLAPINEHRQRENRRSAVISSRAERKKLDTRGLGFTRIAITSALAGGDLVTAAAIAENRYPGELTSFYKAAVGAGTTTHPTWASPLVPAYEQYAAEFSEFLRAETILGQFGTGKIPALRAVPFNISVPRQTTGGKGYWVAAGASKPLTKFDFDNVTLGWAKVANIAVITEELLRFSNPSAELIIRDQLVAALAQVLDEDFIRPDKAAVPDVSPASITNDATPVASSGSSIEAIRKDVKALFAKFVAARMSPSLTPLKKRGVKLFQGVLMQSTSQWELGPIPNARGGTVLPKQQI